MQLLKADLKRNGFRPVWFNAWHHQKEEQLLASFLQTIRKDVLPRWWKRENLRIRLRLLAIRGARNVIPLVILFAALSAGITYVWEDPTAHLPTLRRIAGLVSGSPNEKKKDSPQPGSPGDIFLAIPALGTLAALYRGTRAFGANPATLLANAASGAGSKQLEAKASFRYEFAREFRDLTEALAPSRVLVFIDDLDRCSPEMTLDMLEAVNFLVSAGRCFVVLAMDRNRVEACVALRQTEIAKELGRDPVEYARDYLDKLVQIEIPIQPMKDAEASAIAAQEPKHESLAERGNSWRRAFRWTPLTILLLFGVSLLVPATGTWLLSRPQPVPAASPSSPSPAATPKQESPNQTSPANPIALPSTNPSAANRPNDAAPEPVFQPAPPSRVASIAWVAVPAIFLAAIVAVWQILRPPPNLHLDDVKGFKDACVAWAPYVAKYKNSPRALKRFLNKVRYLATFRALRDSSLVALAAIEYLKPAALASSGELDALSTAPQSDTLAQAAQEGIRKHQQSSLPWPPTDEELCLFHEVRLGIRVADERHAKAAGLNL